MLPVTSVVYVYPRGRQSTRFCKRGHIRIPKVRCQKCHSYMQKLRYARDATYRQKKKDYQTQYRQEFREQFGFDVNTLYRQKKQK